MRVLVIGGGMAGASIGYELSAEADVVLLEQERQLAYHTTGRSAAMYLQSYGNRPVRALTAASRPDFDRLQAEFETPPLLIEKPLLWTADEEALPHLEQLLGTESPLRRLSAEEAIALCPVLRPERLVAAAQDLSAMEMDVLSIHGAYVTGLRRRGGDIRTSARLERLGRDGSGWSAWADGEEIYADVVVDAAGAWADEVAALAGQPPIGLRPLRRTIFTSPVRQPDPGSWPFIGDAADRFYFKGEQDFVLVSPADEVPDEPRDAKPEEVDIAAAIEVVNEHTTLGLRSVRTAWAGLRSFVADRSPVLGARAGEPGFFWFAGQGGYGIQMAPGLARSAASLLLRGSLPDDVSALGLDPAELSPDRF